MDLRVYILFLFLLGIYYLIRWPIAALDTDLWYHLSHGRYIFEHKSLPQTSYFSFISPLREWVDYYWLFQVLVYKIYSFAQYYGLILLRAAVYLGAVLFIFLYFFSGQERKNSYFYLTLVFSLCFLLLLARFQLVRPHTFSYFFIPCFLYILECKPQKAIFLPILAALWCNLHGVEYPVMLLICVSFLLELLITHLRRREHIKKNELFYVFSLIISLCAVYFTPHGSNLIGVPLISTEYASQYIAELWPMKITGFFSFEGTRLNPTVFNILVVLSCIAFGSSIARSKIRISHILMFAGGAVLLTKGIRFIYEFVLLSLPLLRSHPLKLSLENLAGRKKGIAALAMAFILVLPIFYLKNFFSNRPKFPLSPVNLPQGVTTYLNALSVGGFVLNHPNNGGYSQWVLHPKYKIFMDMEVPFLFTDEDFFTAANAFTDPEVLRKITSKYDPSFISVPIEKKEFRGVIKKFPNYTLVFFDNTEVLYINRNHYPAIAEKYQLDIDPFDLFGKDIDTLINLKGKDLLLKNLSTLTEIYPDCLATNQILAMFYNKEGQYQKAITHADKLIQNYPETPMGYRLKGIALKGLKLCDEAIPIFKIALKRSNEEAKRDIYKQMAYAYVEKREYDKAYTFFRKGVSIFSPETTYKDLFDVSSAALLSGKVDQAIFFLRLASKKVPPEDDEYQERIKQQLSRLGFSEGD